MAQFHEVNSFSEYKDVVASLQDLKVPIFAEFYGAHDSSGKSWCPDCVKAEPIVEEVMKNSAPVGTHFLHVSVGNRSEWKDPTCEFRTNTSLKLTCIPTLIKLGTSLRLLEDDCANKEKVVKFVTS